MRYKSEITFNHLGYVCLMRPMSLLVMEQTKSQLFPKLVRKIMMNPYHFIVMPCVLQ